MITIITPDTYRLIHTLKVRYVLSTILILLRIFTLLMIIVTKYYHHRHIHCSLCLYSFDIVLYYLVIIESLNPSLAKMQMIEKQTSDVERTINLKKKSSIRESLKSILFKKKFVSQYFL